MVSVHVDTGLEMRGGQWQALYLARGLAEQGHVTYLLAPKDSPLLKAALAEGLEASPLNLGALALVSRSADLIHAHDARAHTLGTLFAQPLIVSRRVAFPVRRGLLSRWKYRRATQYLAVSQFVKQKLLEAGVDDSRVTVVYDGVPIPPPAQGPRRERILALDSDDPGKGKGIIKKAAALANVPVTFSKNLESDLPDAAMFVYISDSEGLGSAALLAMAYGVPVIASAVGGLPEIVEEEGTGLLTSNHPEAVAVRIRRLLEDRSLALRLAARARARVEQEFSIDRMVRETMRVYERMVV